MNKLLALIIFSCLLLSCSNNIHQQKKQYIKFKNTGRHISIKLKVNQYDEGNFYFDTGSPWLIIDSAFYKKHKMTFHHLSDYEMKGVGNNKAKMIRVLDTIKFSANNNTFFSKHNVIYNLQNIGGNKIDGVVGFVNFNNMPFKVDFIAQKIIFNPKVDNSYQEVKIKFDGYLVYLPTELKLKNGATIRGDFVIDTGSKETVLTSQFANNRDIVNSKKVNYKSNGGISGLHTGFSLFASEVIIDRFKLIDRQIDVSKDSLGALSKNENNIGIIGNDVLDDFDIIYHPTQNKIWVKPNKNFNKPLDDLYKPFVLLEKNDENKGWIVGSIYEESDAYKKGLRHQDEIMEINNKSIKKLNLEKFTRNLKPNQKLKLKVKRQNVYFEIDTFLNVFLKKND